MRHTISMLAVALIALMLGNSNAYAEDGKIYPGISCQSNSDANSHGKYSWDGRAYNLSSSLSIRFVCPIVRDGMKDYHMDWGYGDGIKSGWVRVIDENPYGGQDVKCTMSSTASSGSGAWGWFEVKSSLGSSPNPQMLTFGSLPHYSGSGYYHLSCDVPPSFDGKLSNITAYRINEY